MEWGLTGEFVSAERAYEVGLVNRLTEPGAALDTAVELAGRIAGNGPLAVRASKRIMLESADWSAAETFPRMAEINAPVRGSQDAREGALAFKEKRPPVWQGR
jgi:enoyl-CoA hydratase